VQVIFQGVFWIVLNLSIYIGDIKVELCSYDFNYLLLGVGIGQARPGFKRPEPSL